MISPPCVAIRSLTFAVSMLVPPPTATNPSKFPSAAKSAASWNESAVGSTRARSQSSTSIPSREAMAAKARAVAAPSTVTWGSKASARPSDRP